MQLVFFKAREHLEQEHSEEGGGSSGNALPPPPMKVKTAGELAAGGGSDGDGDEDEEDDDDDAWFMSACFVFPPIKLCRLETLAHGPRALDLTLLTGSIRKS